MQEQLGFLLTACSKMREERDGVKKELVSKNEPQFAHLENSQPVHSVNMRKLVLKRTLKYSGTITRERVYGTETLLV